MQLAHMARGLISALLLATVPVWAHHSIAADFDSSKPIVLRGKVTKLDWMNPHVFIWIDAVDERGSVKNWMLESVAPNYLQRLGWTKQTMKVGSTVVTRAFQAKDQKYFAKTDSITLPDGRCITTGRAVDRAERKPRE